MAASDARPIPRKNTAMRIYFPILDADGDLVTGASSLDSEVSLDGAAFADCTSEATEIGTTGNYYLDLTASEMNADAVVVQVKTATSGAKTTVIVMYPEEAGDVRADVVAISGDTAAADNLEAAADGTGYNLGGGSVVAASVTGAVGSVTGNVTGSVGSVAAGGITAGSIAADAIGASELAADAVAEIQSGLALEASVQTVLSRLGAFAGSGVNTVLGFFKALAKSDASAPSDMGGTFDPATDSLEAHTDGSGGGASAAEVWAYATRTLTQTAASVASVMAGSTITVTRGDTETIALTGLGSVSGRQALWFTVKADPINDTDAESKIQATEAGGLIYLNGAAATSGQATVTVTSAAAGNISVVLAAAATAQLAVPSSWSYDVQWKDATGLIHTLTRGTFIVADDVTRAVS